MSAVFKQCSCGDSLTEQEWNALDLVGVLDDEGLVLEMRNHKCGSTIAIVLQDNEAA